jgi:hypothetical protein
MNVYYTIAPVESGRAHISFIIRKCDLSDNNSSLGEIVRDLIEIVRDSKGALGLLEQRGKEFRINTVHPVIMREFDAVDSRIHI